jgi:hypothetical protein
MTLDIPTLRPAVLTRATAAAMDPFLAFRHRFRNPYVFVLERAPLLARLARGDDAWRQFDADLDTFSKTLECWTRTLE